MRKLEIINAEEQAVAIRNEISRSDESRYDHRLHGILLVSEKMSCYEAGRILGEDPKTLEIWVKKFNTGGFNALREGKRNGRPSKLTLQEMDEIDGDLRKNPKEFNYEQNLWDGKLLKHHIYEKYHKELSVRACQMVFHRLGFRMRKPRPLIAKGDPVKKDTFKKNSQKT